MNQKQKLRLAVNLDGELMTQFLDVQKKLGIKSYTDVIRFLIKWYYDMLIVKKVIEKKE